MLEGSNNLGNNLSGVRNVKDEMHDNPSYSQAERNGRSLAKFDWKNRWLNGEEYYQILTNAELYASAFSFSKYPQKTHPSSTYTNPESTLFGLTIIDGTIYFVDGCSVGSEFGFPRIATKKHYKW